MANDTKTPETAPAATKPKTTKPKVRVKPKSNKPAKKTGGDTGKRYTEAQKQKILEFVAKEGRGGITAAGKKFGVSYVALRRWMNTKSKPAKVSKSKRPGSAPTIAGFGSVFAEVEAEMTAARNAFNVTMTRLEQKVKDLKQFFNPAAM